MRITLQVLTDIYSKPDKTGKQKLIKRNVISRKQFETCEILVEEYLNAKGIASKKWCMLKCADDYFRVNHRFEDIEKLTGHIKVEGFKYANTKKV